MLTGRYCVCDHLKWGAATQCARQTCKHFHNKLQSGWNACYWAGQILRCSRYSARRHSACTKGVHSEELNLWTSNIASHFHGEACHIETLNGSVRWRWNSTNIKTDISKNCFTEWIAYWPSGVVYAILLIGSEHLRSPTHPTASTVYFSPLDRSVRRQLR